MSQLLTAEEEVELALAIEAGVLAGERLTIAPRLTLKEKSDLEQIVSLGLTAKERMVTANLGLVKKIAYRYLGQGLDYEDLIQEAQIGLMLAVEKFDYARGNKFSTHAIWWIRYALTIATANQGRTIRVPRDVYEKLNKLRSFELKTVAALGRKPTLAESAAELDTTIERVKFFGELRWSVLSLDVTVSSDSDARLGDLLTDAIPVEPAAQIEIQELRQAIQTEFETLPTDVRRLLEFWFWDCDGKLPTAAICKRVFGWERPHYATVLKDSNSALDDLRAKLGQYSKVAI